MARRCLAWVLKLAIGANLVIRNHRVLIADIAFCSPSAVLDVGTRYARWLYNSEEYRRVHTASTTTLVAYTVVISIVVSLRLPLGGRTEEIHKV